MRRLPLFLAALAVAAPLRGQDRPTVRAGAQYVQYTLGDSTDQTISELAIPLFVVVPLARGLTMDVGTAYAQSEVKGGKATSRINGFTDTQVRANLSLGTDAVILTAGVNVPTGRETATLQEFDAATRIGSDLLSFPISNMGTGLGGTAGIAFARSLGAWNLGAGGSVRMTRAYRPLRFAPDSSLRYQPGNEYRARVGLDRTVGEGMVSLGFTYSTFGRDSIASSVYNSGDRYIGQVAYSTRMPIGQVTLVAWNLYRGAGMQGRTQRVPWENLASGSVGLAFPAGRLSVEPSLAARYWLQRIDATGSSAARTNRSVLGDGELRVRIPTGRFAVVPAVGYSTGRLAVGADKTVPITGFRGSIGLQIN
ncbi:MAG TPA: hypothetical protein VGD77_08395 [Gemmatimonadaceae bacterium]